MISANVYFYKGKSMVKHIVLWKLKDFAEGVDKQTNIRRMRKLLESLPERIGVIKTFEVGVNAIPSDAAWDVSLYAEFATKEDLEIYQKHPEHLKVGEFVGKVRELRALVDYERR
jgi:hypothetical protein